VAFVQEGDENDTKDKRGAGRRLDVPLWMLAWDSYALAAAVLEQVGLPALWCFSNKYINIVLVSAAF
jgi:hypothetical protein